MTFAKPKKSLGQNFLIQPAVVEKIIGAANLNLRMRGETSAFAEGLTSGRSHVLEVGPGRGVLTHALLDAGADVTAVEKDDALFIELQKTFAKEIAENKLKLIHADILDHLTPGPSPKGRGELGGNPLPFGEGEGGEVGNFKVVANIPYYITGELLRKFLSGQTQPKQMTLMVQREVAKRICTRDKESLLSLSVKVYGTPKYIATVGKGNFYPVPNVDSAILNVENISKDFFKDLRVGNLWKSLGTTSEEVFFSLLHAGFAHKRKYLLGNLASLTDKNNIVALFKANNISEKSRAEDLSLSSWRALLTFNS